MDLIIDSVRNLVLVTIGLLVLFIVHVVFRYKYWKQRNIITPEYEFLYGNMKDLFNFKRTEGEVLFGYSSKFNCEKYYGMYSLWKPVLVVKDLQVAKLVMEKYFDSFIDRPAVSGNKRTDKVSHSLFTMNGDVWRSRRTALTRLFTPMKLRDAAEKYIPPPLKGLKGKLEDAAGDVELFELTEDYPIQALASAMYGVDLTGDKKRTSLLRNLADGFLRPSKWNVAMIGGYHIYPTLFNMLGVTSLPTSHDGICAGFTRELIDTRKNGNAQRSDLITAITSMMNEGIRNGEKIDFSEASAHVYTFLQAGSHSTHITLCHCLFQLAQHPEAQDKLRKEINEKINDINSITYEELQRLTYMDKVIYETLRLFPVLGVLKRVCVKDVAIDDKLTIEKGTDVYIDATYIQRDPANYFEPDKFNPERFENNEEPQAYMPFGRGLRKCIGMKLAILELKIGIAAIIASCKLSPSTKMKLPIKFDPTAVIVSNFPTHGLLVNIQKI